jgi:hypothetical protein
MGRADSIVARVRVAADAFGSMRSALEAGEPWPLAADFGPGPEASWGPPEILAHVGEMLPYWLAEAGRVVAGPGWPVPFGRLQTDEARLAAVEQDRRLPIGQLLGRIDRAGSAYADVLPGWDDDALERRGLHPTRGEVSVAELLERHAVAHAEEHLRQLRESLEGRG